MPRFLYKSAILISFTRILWQKTNSHISRLVYSHCNVLLLITFYSFIKTNKNYVKNTSFWKVLNRGCDCFIQWEFVKFYGSKINHLKRFKSKIFYIKLLIGNLLQVFYESNLNERPMRAINLFKMKFVITVISHSTLYWQWQNLFLTPEVLYDIN